MPRLISSLKLKREQAVPASTKIDTRIIAMHRQEPSDECRARAQRCAPTMTFCTAGNEPEEEQAHNFSRQGCHHEADVRRRSGNPGSNGWTTRFFVYLDASTDQVNVIYRRNDGNYGLIVPKQ